MFSLPVGTEMFHFPTFPPHALCVQARVTPHDWCGVPPFGNPRINARLTAPRGLSQPPTSFIGSWCQGIHRAPLITWPQRCSRPLCSSQRTDDPTTQPGHTPTEAVSRRSWSVPQPAPNTPNRGARGQTALKKLPLPQDPTARHANRTPRPPDVPPRSEDREY